MFLPAGLPVRACRRAAAAGLPPRTAQGFSPRVSPAGSVGTSQPTAERCPLDTRAPPPGSKLTGPLHFVQFAVRARTGQFAVRARTGQFT